MLGSGGLNFLDIVMYLHLLWLNKSTFLCKCVYVVALMTVLKHEFSDFSQVIVMCTV